MSGASLIPRGIPLTDSMPFTGRDGASWLGYIEAAPPDNPWGMWYRATLPGRRLRFDSAGESRVSASVPPGAPFLPEHRLQLLLESAQPLPPAPPPARSRYKPWRRNVVVRWFSRVADVGDAMRAESARRWRVGEPRRATIRHRMRRGVSGVVGAVQAMAGSLPGKRGAES